VLANEWRNLDGRRISIEQKNENGEIVRGTKTGEERTRVVDVPDPVLADLAKWRLSQRRPEGLIFPNRSGAQWTKYQWDAWRRRWFNPAAEAAGWTFPPKDLRHTCASLMLAAGFDPAQIAEHLGHTLAVSVSNYQHLMDQQRGKPTRPMDEWIRAARAEVFGKGSESEAATS
jgi:integrase